MAAEGRRNEESGRGGKRGREKVKEEGKEGGERKWRRISRVAAINSSD